MWCSGCVWQITKKLPIRLPELHCPLGHGVSASMNKWKENVLAKYEVFQGIFSSWADMILLPNINLQCGDCVAKCSVAHTLNCEV